VELTLTGNKKDQGRSEEYHRRIPVHSAEAPVALTGNPDYAVRERWRPIGGGRTSRIEFRGVDLRVPDVVLKSVGFVGQVLHQDSSGVVDTDWVGTGFFISIPGRLIQSTSFHAFVTAKHIARLSKVRTFALRSTRKMGE
jgi:hypothetical protein